MSMQLEQLSRSNRERINDLIRRLNAISPGVTEYLHDDVSDIANYKVLSSTHPDDAKFDISASVTGADQELEQFATASGVPGVVLLPHGLYHLHFHAHNTTSGGKDLVVYFKIYRYEADTTETVLFTSESSGVLAATSTSYEIHGYLTAEQEWAATDRIVLKIFATPSGTGSNPTIHLEIDGTSESRLSFAIPLLLLGDIVNDTAYSSAMDGVVGQSPSLNVIWDKLDNYIKPIVWGGQDGFLKAEWMYYVLSSDINAKIEESFIIKETRTDYKFTIVSYETNGGITNSGVITAGKTADGAVESSTNLFNGVNMDLVHDAVANTNKHTNTATFSATKGDTIYASWTKDANDGAGTLVFKGLIITH